jgi:hypothetical protein
MRRSRGVAAALFRAGALPWLLAGLLLTVSSLPASAQMVLGRVVDEGTGEGVSLARIAVLVGDSVAVGPSAADQEGRFRLRLPGPGTYRLQVERLGYPLHTTLEFRAGPFEEVEVQIPIAPEPIPLAPLEIVARGPERGRDQFARRRAAGQGVFVDPIHIALMREAGRIRTPTDVVRQVEGIDVDFHGVISATRGFRCIAVFLDHSPISLDRAFGGAAVPEEFGGRLGLHEILDPREIMAAEVYRSIDEVPREIRAGVRWQDVEGLEGGRCGVVWFWTTMGW